MVEIYVVRHGETDTNHLGRINGGDTDFPLNSIGIKQAQSLRDNMNIRNFDAIYTSPLKRAYQTAEIINQEFLDIKKDDRIKEINYGSWDGLDIKTTASKYPDGFDQNNYVSDKYINYAKDGESYEHVYSRVKDFMNDLINKGDKKILVVCHGFISRAFFKIVTHIPNISDVIQPDNASVVKFKIDNKTKHAFLVYYGRLDNIDTVAQGSSVHE